jgi:hypothetical protein
MMIVPAAPTPMFSKRFSRAQMPQGTHLLMRVQPRFGLVDGRHVSASSSLC